MNYFVHSIMYGYYAARAMGYRPPKGIAMLITTCQICQMVIGCTVNIWAAQYVADRQPCHVSSTNIKLSIAMYFSYFILFARFFYKAYMSQTKQSDNTMPGKYTSNMERIKSH